MNIVALIPARKGSKSIKNKNIYNVGGHPLIAFTIATCKASKYIKEVIVSTDSKEIAYISKKYGAKVPFLRPKKISRDLSKDKEFFFHYINFLKKNNKKIPEAIVHARPTTPFRNLKIFNKGIKYFLKKKNITSMRSVHESNITPYKIFYIKKKLLKGFFPSKSSEYYNLPRQNFPKTYIPNGYVDIVRPKYFKKNMLHGKKILPFVTKKIIDIDNKIDLINASQEIKKKKYKEILNYLKLLKKNNA